MMAPALIYEDLGVLERALRDYTDGDICQVMTNNLELKEKVENLLKQSDRTKTIKISYSEETSSRSTGWKRSCAKPCAGKV